MPSFVVGIFQILRAEAKGHLDLAGIITLNEMLANVEMRKYSNRKQYSREMFFQIKKGRR